MLNAPAARWRSRRPSTPSLQMDDWRLFLRPSKAEADLQRRRHPDEAREADQLLAACKAGSPPAHPVRNPGTVAGGARRGRSLAFRRSRSRDARLRRSPSGSGSRADRGRRPSRSRRSGCSRDGSGAWRRHSPGGGGGNGVRLRAGSDALARSGCRDQNWAPTRSELRKSQQLGKRPLSVPQQ